ncbi:MAG TPA: pyridoxal 5'-phosphate synthase glutaminase subunit PdxT [Desulfitobacterium dehalogenans]|uniref:Pyridoxal 5'-phosphate synthase glutaminase subunit PdxT n=1 Tax=Desulfitobacterium dehalogenans TaxID=36854 RepID=A0A7C6Z6W8_9FIRM|nr:pyridoxal 5'-phosphate synthase glutaminase subunit PdxT [Desulfitobacterium dehalogenans]
MNERIGVLSLGGTDNDPCQFLKELRCEVIKVQQREDLINIQGLIITGPGNRENSLLISGLGDRIKELAAMDFPIFGLCAGMVLLCKGSPGYEKGQLGLMDLTVAKEPMEGRTEAYLSIPALGVNPMKAIFSEAPCIQEIAPNVGILAEYNGKIVFVRQGNMLASTFYPGQTSDDRIYRYFLDIINEEI